MSENNEPVSPKYCWDCGEEVGADDSRCTNCGADLNPDASDANTDGKTNGEQSTTIEPDHQPSEPTSHGKSTGKIPFGSGLGVSNFQPPPKPKQPVSPIPSPELAQQDMYKNPDPGNSFADDDSLLINFRELIYFPLGNGHTLMRRVGMIFLIFIMAFFPYGAYLSVLLWGGYMVMCMRNVFEDHKHAPEWRNWGQLLSAGLFSIATLFLYGAGPRLLGEHMLHQGSTGVANLLQGISLIGFVWFPFAQLRFAETNNWMAMFDFVPVGRNLARNFKEYFLGILHALASYFLGVFYVIYAIFAFPVWVFTMRDTEVNHRLAPAKFYAATLIQWIVNFGFFATIFSRGSAGCILTVILFFVAWIFGVYAIQFGFIYWVSVLFAAVMAHAYRGNRIRFRR